MCVCVCVGGGGGGGGGGGKAIPLIVFSEQEVTSVENDLFLNCQVCL